MKLTTCLLFILLVLASCRDDDAVFDEAWLNARIAEIQQSSIADYSFILQAQYDKRSVFIFDNCCPFCASLPPQVHAVDGTLIGYMGIDIDEAEVNQKTIYWQTENGQCVLTDLHR